MDTKEQEKARFSATLNSFIDCCVLSFEDTAELTHTEFSDLLSLGELIDRLTIVNIKLFNLKTEVMNNRDDTTFLERAPVYDVRLCEERARIKACIDKKVMLMIKGGTEFNEEVKRY